MKNKLFRKHASVIPTGAPTLRSGQAARSGGIPSFNRFLATLGMTALLYWSATAQGNGVTVSNPVVEAGSPTTVTFTVSWNRNTMPKKGDGTTILWLDSAWVFVDYYADGTAKRLPLLPGATLTETSAPGSAKVIQYPDNDRGVWVAGNAKQTSNSSGSFSATVQLFSAVASVEHAGVCAYASNYPPVGEYVDAQTIKFTGTPMFKIVLEPVPCKMSAVYNLAVSATAFCAGSEGVRFALSGTDSGVSYQLFRNNSAVDGAVLAGTGSAATFSGVFGEGAYTARSIADGVQCPAVAMAGTHNITVNPLPTITYLSGSTEQLLYASGTLTPIRYTTSGATTATITGTLPANLSGNWFNGTLTLSGAVPSVSGSQTYSYTVGARNQSTGCESASRLTGAIRLLASLPAYSTNVTAAAGKSWSDALTVVPTGCTQTDNTALDYAYTERSGIYYYSYLCIVKYVAPFCASPWYPPTSDITGITSSDIKTVIGKAGRYSPAYSDTGNYYLWLLSPDPAKPVALDDGSWGPYSTSHAPTVRMAFRCVK